LEEKKLREYSVNSTLPFSPSVKWLQSKQKSGLMQGLFFIQIEFWARKALIEE
jgi:hypothetical protein